MLELLKGMIEKLEQEAIEPDWLLRHVVKSDGGFCFVNAVHFHYNVDVYRLLDASLPVIC